jgi:hypothetical protein
MEEMLRWGRFYESVSAASYGQKRVQYPEILQIQEFSPSIPDEVLDGSFLRYLVLNSRQKILK